MHHFTHCCVQPHKIAVGPTAVQQANKLQQAQALAASLNLCCAVTTSDGKTNVAYASLTAVLH